MGTERVDSLLRRGYHYQREGGRKQSRSQRAEKGERGCAGSPRAFSSLSPASELYERGLNWELERVERASAMFSQHAPKACLRSQAFLPQKQKITLIVLPRKIYKMSLNDAEVRKQVSV